MQLRAKVLEQLAAYRRGYAESHRRGWDFGKDYYRIEFYAVLRAIQEGENHGDTGRV